MQCDVASRDGSGLTEGLGPLPESVDLLQVTWRGDREFAMPLGDYYTADQMRAYAAAAVASEREHNAGWFALVMNAAAALEDAANCLRDPDAKRAAEGAAKHYRAAANAMWASV